MVERQLSHDEEGVLCVPHNILHLLVCRDCHSIVCCAKLRLEVQEFYHWDECNTPGFYFFRVEEFLVLAVRVVVTIVVRYVNLFSFKEELQPLYLVFHLTCIKEERLSIH